MESKRIAVLGGGVTGLAAAHRLTTLGARVRLFEQGPRIGGAIRTERTGGWLVEAGPNSLQDNSPEVSALMKEIGLDAERLEAGPVAKNRYLVRRGRLMPAPLSAGALFSSPLFSLGAKARILSELFRCRRARAGDASLADFARDHFGSEIVDYAVQPIVSGVCAGDPARLSTREAFPKLWAWEKKHGSLLRGQSADARARRASGLAAPEIISFRNGLQALPEALAARLPAGAIALNCPVERLAPGPGWQVAYRNDGRQASESFDAVISALPAPSLARLLIGQSAEKPLAALSRIEHPPVSSLFLGFRRDQVAHPLDGFGVLVPAVERRSILGILFSSSLFSGRAPAGHVALTVMTGGALQPQIARQATSELLASVRPDLEDLLGISGEPAFVRHHFWPQAIPQYQLGHEAHREAMAECERAHTGLFIGGQARDGISIPQCLASGLALASRAAGF